MRTLGLRLVSGGNGRLPAAHLPVAINETSATAGSDLEQTFGVYERPGNSKNEGGWCAGLAGLQGLLPVGRTFTGRARVRLARRAI